MAFSLSPLSPMLDFIAKGDLRSMFCLIVFLIVFFVLAYLTNPSENSFRAYLTEQSFRLHLSRLDDSADESHSSLSSRPRFSSPPSTSSVVAIDNSSLFHFANRASIGLRTPKHVFHRFAIFTIAAMVPTSKSSDSDVRDGWMISDSWYIGAFGKWWRGGVLEAWYQDVIARSKDEESWSSGILSMKRLDILQDYDAPTFTAKSLPSHLLRASPPRLRNRERPTLRHNNVQPRSQTPPPLPKSVSLPMHTSRKSSANSDRICDRAAQIQAPHHAQPCIPPSSLGPSRTPSGLFEHSPLIEEVLHQIANSKSSVNDLRTQLSECTTTASQTHSVLQVELDLHRDRKKQEDASKLELRTRTKALEDSKRGAESLKKEAEKRLKNLQSARNGARQRMDLLDDEILGLQKSLAEDRDYIERHRSQISDEERDITRNLEQKRSEIKSAEDTLTVLNQRSRELEERLASERDRLKALRSESDRLRRQFRVPVETHSPQIYAPEEQWNVHSPTDADLHPSHIHPGDGWDSLNVLLNGQSNAAYDNKVTNDISSTLRPTVDPLNGSKVIMPLQPPFAPLPSFMSFEDSPQNNGHVLGSGLKDGTSVNGNSTGLARDIDSLQSDSDLYTDITWRSPLVSTLNDYHKKPFKSGFSLVTSPSAGLHRSHMSTQQSPGQSGHYAQDRSILPSPTELHSSIWGPDADINYPLDSNLSIDSSHHLHLDQGLPAWFSRFEAFNEKSNGKGLNPDAKEFSLFRKHAAPATAGTANGLVHNHAPHAAYDALNPNGLGSMASMTASSTTTNQSLLRAFAPSPAEREALQRALGGSANTSLERLPSLSDVGSIPASPTNSHALPHVPQHVGRGLGNMLPAWLQSLPRARKVNFSPWEDEEPVAESKAAIVEQQS
ncbi:hypothetical protein CPC08DRAFT_662730 [Agrocybe pediades]|nr:hypothetical protein CPC08DRAFT_662730 [Agrocybe pediades]